MISGYSFKKSILLILFSYKINNLSNSLRNVIQFIENTQSIIHVLFMSNGKGLALLSSEIEFDKISREIKSLREINVDHIIPVKVTPIFTLFDGKVLDYVLNNLVQVLGDRLVIPLLYKIGYESGKLTYEVYEEYLKNIEVENKIQFILDMLRNQNMVQDYEIQKISPVITEILATKIPESIMHFVRGLIAGFLSKIFEHDYMSLVELLNGKYLFKFIRYEHT